MKKYRSLLDELKKERCQILAPREEHKKTDDQQKQRVVKRRASEQKAAFTYSPVPAKS
jgi:hypothetical protein